MDGGVAALGRADRVDAAGVAGRRDQGVVAALALGAPDRVDRREVDDVEAELGETGELGLDAGEAPPRAREELIPGPEAGPHPLDLDRRDEVHARRRAAIGGARGGRDHLRAERVRGALGEAALAVLEHGGRRREAALVLAARAGRRLAQQQRPLGELARDVLLAGGELALELLAPRRLGIGPGLDRPAPRPLLGHGEGGLEAVLAALEVGAAHRRLAPERVIGPAVAHDRAHRRRAVAEDERADLDAVADAGLGRVATAVDQRLGVLDLNPRRRCGCQGQGHALCSSSLFRQESIGLVQSPPASSRPRALQR